MMSDLVPLSNAHCIPRRGDDHRLPEARVRELLPQVPDWTLAEDGRATIQRELALRGLRTLSVRLERASANARVLAERLEGHAGVERVRYPGFGAMVSIDVDGGAEAAERVAAATRLWVHATSLGGVESQIERRRRQPGEPEAVPVNLLRLSVGIEDVEDLWRDLDAALGAV